METYILAGLVYLAAGLLQGVTGFGSALVAIPLLTLLMPVRVAVPLSVLCGVAITMSMAWSMRRDFNFRRVLPMFVGVLPGIAAGTALLTMAKESLMLASMGIMLIGYSAWGLLARPRPLIRDNAWGRFWGTFAGFFTGAIATAFSAGGPPVIIYVSLTDWTKDEIKAGLSGMFVMLAPLIAIAHAISGVTGPEALNLAAVCIPAALAGSLMGMRFSRHIGEALYKKALYVTLGAMGVMMFVRA